VALTPFPYRSAVMNSRKLLQGLGVLLATSAVLWFGFQLVRNSSAFSVIDSTSIIFVGMAILVYSASAFVSNSAWFVLLRSVGEHQSQVWQALSIGYLSQAGKYIPGNVAHHFGRVVLAKRHGLGMSNTLFTMFVETVWVVAIAALLALAVLMSAGRHLFEEIPYIPQWWALAGVISIAILAPSAAHSLFERAARWWARRKEIEISSVRMPTLRTFWLISLMYVANYLILGIVLHIIASQIFGEEKGGILLLSGVFAVAWIAGFLTPGAPAGLGVREVVLVAALTPIYGSETAVGVAAILRVVTVLGDGLVFLEGLGLERLISSKPELS
jgi:uncharacterized membrane protein YbhN (UPF0104 family)